MTHLLATVTRLTVLDDDGQDLVEYAFLAGLIAVVAFAGVRTLGETILAVFWEVIQRGF